MKDKKRQFVWFSFYNYIGIREHLEKMAEEGWMIEKLGNFLWHYRRIESSQLQFSVNYFPNGSDFDPEPTEGQKRMEEYCEKTGWKVAARWGSMQIFYNEALNPIPIETDALTQVETVHRTMRKSMLVNSSIMVVLCVLQLLMQFERFTAKPMEYLARPSDLVMIPLWTILLLTDLLEIYFYFHWYLKAKKEAENGVFSEIKTHAHSALSFGLISMSILVMLWGFGSTFVGRNSLLFGFGMLAVIFILMGFLKNRMKKAGFSGQTNMLLSSLFTFGATLLIIVGFTVFVFKGNFLKEHKPIATYEADGWNFDVYDDILPLYVDDLVIVAEQVNWSKEMRTEESFILSHIQCRQWPLMERNSVPGLEYTITEVKLPFLYDFSKNALINERRDEIEDGKIILTDHYEKIDAKPWNALDAYQVYWDDGYLEKYLLCYEDRFVEIRFDFEPTPEQMLIVAEKLGK